MGKNKLTLEDLKLESFLTELGDSNLMKVQGGMGGYGDTENCHASDDCQESNDCRVTEDECTATTTEELETAYVCEEDSYAEFCYETNLCSEEDVCYGTDENETYNGCFSADIECGTNGADGCNI